MHNAARQRPMRPPLIRPTAPLRSFDGRTERGVDKLSRQHRKQHRKRVLQKRRRHCRGTGRRSAAPGRRNARHDHTLLSAARTRGMPAHILRFETPVAALPMRKRPAIPPRLRLHGLRNARNHSKTAALTLLGNALSTRTYAQDSSSHINASGTSDSSRMLSQCRLFICHAGKAPS